MRPASSSLLSSGVMSSRGLETMVPSSRFMEATFGSSAFMGSRNTSRMAEPSKAMNRESTSTTSPLDFAEKWAKP